MAPDTASIHPRKLLALALAALGLLVAPAAAQAAYATVDDTGTLKYAGGSSEANRVTVALTPEGAVEVTESGRYGEYPAAIWPGSGCDGWGVKVTCAGVSRIAFSTSDGGDHIDASAVALPATVTSGSGNDVVTLGPAADSVSVLAGDDVVDAGGGADVVDVGGGNDRVLARDGTVDQITCGAGSDGGEADAGDAVAADCESVLLPEPAADPVEPEAPQPTGPATRSEAPPVNQAPPTVPAQTAVVTRSGVARVQVGCPADAGSCKGTIALVLLGSRDAPKLVAARRRPVRRIGRTKFTAQAGEKPIIPVRLNRRGRRRILRGRKRNRCYARVVITTRTADGKRIRTRRTITLERRSARRVSGGKKGRGRKR